MNAQGNFVNARDSVSDAPLHRVRATIHAFRYFILIVLVPTSIIAAYYYTIAADQWESESHFIVSAASAPAANVGGLGSLLGIGSASESQSQMVSVSDYLRSHDAVAALRASLPLVQMFQRPEADAFSELRNKNPTPEALLRYYRGKVEMTTNHDNGIVTLKARAFRARDAFVLNRALLKLGEEQVNRMNDRRYRDAVSMAERQLRSAEQSAAAMQQQMTSFRQHNHDVDPQTSGEVQIRLVADLRARLAQANAQLATMGSLIQPRSPQYIAMRHQVEALEAQLATQSVRLSAGPGNLATSLGGYEALRVRQEFATKRYDAAAASLEKAREDAQRQQLYLIRVVDADQPVASLFPERGRIVLTVFIALCLAYGVGWLILAGVREHVA